ncbi:MAG TPA: TrbG/VirB9 family P-type conjugative transfer protein [Burkholderiaceae bacterium]
MNYFTKLIIPVLTTLSLLTACDNAVRVKKNVTYSIKGDPQNVIYPLAVKPDSEDVRIQMKESAPIPEIFSIDARENAVAFNFTTEGSTIIVPGKFDHLQLRLKGAKPIDIIGSK